jgi:hypothetical protein
MFEPLLVADPAFVSAWQRFCEDYADEVELPQYIALGDFAHHLIERLKAGETAGMRDVFGVIERWHIEGDDYVREAASIGLLEGLQNILGGDGRSKETGSINAQIEHWLGPESKRWWDKLDRFWAGDRTALRYDD